MACIYSLGRGISCCSLDLLFSPAYLIIYREAHVLCNYLTIWGIVKIVRLAEQLIVFCNEFYKLNKGAQVFI